MYKFEELGKKKGFVLGIMSYFCSGNRYDFFVSNGAKSLHSFVPCEYRIEEKREEDCFHTSLPKQKNMPVEIVSLY